MEKMVIALDEKRYGRLLAKALPAVIQTEEENEKVLSQIETLMDKGAQRTPEEDRLLELLSRLSEDFESTQYDFGNSKPNEVLAFLLEKKDLRQADLLPVLGCTKGTLSDMISGRREITASTARKLADFFQLPVDVFV